MRVPSSGGGNEPMQVQVTQPIPPRVRVDTDGDRVTFAVAAAGVRGDARLLLTVGLLGCALLGALALVIGLMQSIAGDLRAVGIGCAIVAGTCLLAVCGWEAIQAARARATLTLDGDTLVVREYGPGWGRTHRWLKGELKSLAVGFNVVRVRAVSIRFPKARGSEHVLWVELATGQRVPLLGSCGLGDELPWLAAALSRHLGIPDFTLGWDVAPVGPATGDLDVDLSVDAATAARGGRVPITLRREDGSEQRVEVVLPPGTQNGRRLRLKGLGVGGKDLDIRVEIRELA